MVAVSNLASSRTTSRRTGSEPIEFLLGATAVPDSAGCPEVLCGKGRWVANVSPFSLDQYPPVEPYRIKVVEAIRLPTPEERERALERAGYNLFNLRSSEVFVDLLTDSGTSAMSDRQWAGLMVGDESYAGSRNYEHFEATVRELTGFPEVIPAHQGRAAEHLLISTLVHAGQIVPNNMHFDTTQAHVVHVGASPLNLAIREAYEPAIEHSFKGNLDTRRLATLLDGPTGDRVPLVMVTITNNTGGGHPVSLANLREVSRICRAAAKPLYLDMCRWAENAYLIQTREEGQRNRSVRSIGRDVFDLADGATMSAKKDGLVNIGGFVALRDPELARRLREALILFEGFPTYGGLARRDLESISIGLTEGADERYLEHRIGQVRFLAERLTAEGIPIMRPAGGHGVYLDATKFLPHLRVDQLPGQALVVELYREGAVRAVEIGAIMFGDQPSLTDKPLELVRLAIPRRVYTESHLRYVADTIHRVWLRRAAVKGLRLVEAPERLRHFTARFAPEPEGVR
jgi:tyrosine phenol-lyase